MKLILLPAAAALAALGAAPAPAQVQPVSFESFDYNFPGLLGGQNGGTGWLSPWFDTAGNGVVVQADPPTNPTNPFPWGGNDAIGNYSQQAIEFEAAFRMPDPGPHPELVDGGLFGADGATMWFSYSTKQFQQFGDHYGGFSLFEQFAGEKLFTGSPWASYAWGIDDQQMTPMSAPIVPGTSNATTARLVVRVDWMAGDERVRFWVDPIDTHPTTAADIDVMVPDFRWNEIRLSSGGNASLFYWDHLVIEKGEPVGNPVGMSYCGPAIANSTTFPATISGTGSTSAMANNLTLTAEQLPPGQFGYFLAGQTQGFFNPPNSQGIICLSGNIGRFNQVANIITGPTGSIGVNLTAIPVNPPQAAMAGETWNFQCWYRDVNPTATSNFTDGLTITFN